ncbi:hypothetical protein SeLEV6574_g05899 [Synchytrium endobioticum]|uniref:Ras-GEF domain-containing protein n=1 Tax=Synchytrium endobioticum TaxID=286115 RepID=A0A507CRW9_9FUNG|nr:hypothetical protein SeLEV6574_g05899 [Synchytrium endobioticum]
MSGAAIEAPSSLSLWDEGYDLERSHGLPSFMGMLPHDAAEFAAELQQLKQGRTYPAKVTPLLQGKEDVIIKLDFNGIHILTEHLEELLHLELQHVLQYSYNRTKQTFSMSHLDHDGLLSQYKFVTPRYFDIFNFLGKAITAVIKMSNATNTVIPPRFADYNRDSPTVIELPRIPILFRPSAPALTASSQIFSCRPPTIPGSSGVQLSPMSNSGTSAFLTSSPTSHKPLAGLFDGVTTTSGHVVHASTLQKVAIAEIPVEEKYAGFDETVHLKLKELERVPASPPSSIPETPTESKQTEFQFDVGLAPQLSEPSSTSSSAVNLKSPTPTGEGKYTFATLSKLMSKRTVVAAGSEPALNQPLYGRTGSRAKWVVDKWAASTDALAHATVSMRKFAASSSAALNQMSNRTSADILPGNSSIITPHSPTVLKIRDTNNREVLIKNLRDSTAYEIVAGTPEALVDALVDDPDVSYREVFLLTFRHFLTPLNFLKRLRVKFEQSSLEMDGPVDATQVVDGNLPSIIMHRIVSLLKKWVGEHTYDFVAQDMRAALGDFLDEVRTSDYKGHAEQIQHIISYEMALAEGFLKRKGAAVSLSVESPTTPVEPVQQSIAKVRELLTAFDLMSYKAKNIAQQLTLTDSQMFRAIKPEEFAIFLWGDKSVEGGRPLQEYIERFNRIGYWVGTIVCSYEQSGKRTEAIEKFIKIGKRCLDLQNFNSAMAIFSGLNTIAVSRLKKSWANVSSRVMSLYKELEDTLSYRGNYKAYRDLEHLAKPPLIPFFGLMIKDLTFLNDGNQKILSNGLINFEKNRLIFNVINSIQQFQRDRYQIMPASGILTGGKSISLHQYCQSPPCLKDDQLVQLSRLVDPPESKSAADRHVIATSPTSLTSGSAGTLRGFLSLVALSSSSMATPFSPVSEQGGTDFSITASKTGLSPALFKVLTAAEQQPPVSSIAPGNAPITRSTEQIAGSNESFFGPCQAVAEVEEGEARYAISPTTIVKTSSSVIQSENASPTISNASTIGSTTPIVNNGGWSSSTALGKRPSLDTIGPPEQFCSSTSTSITGYGPPSLIIPHTQSGMMSFEAIASTLSINANTVTPSQLRSDIGIMRLEQSSNPRSPITFEDIWCTVAKSLQSPTSQTGPSDAVTQTPGNEVGDCDDAEGDDHSGDISYINPLGIVAPPSDIEVERATMAPHTATSSQQFDAPTPKAVRMMLCRLPSQMTTGPVPPKSAETSPILAHVFDIAPSAARARSDSASTVVKLDMNAPAFATSHQPETSPCVPKGHRTDRLVLPPVLSVLSTFGTSLYSADGPDSVLPRAIQTSLSTNPL